jgi:hypothetical protein
MGWAPRAPSRFNVTAGRWYGAGGASNSSAATNGAIRAVPLEWPGGRIVGIGVEVITGSADSTVRLGIYADEDGVPGDLIVETAPVSSVSAGAIDVDIDVTLGAGLYWLAALVQGGTPTLRANGAYAQEAVGSSSPTVAVNGRASYAGDTLTSGAMPVAFGTVSVGLPGFSVLVEAG